MENLDPIALINDAVASRNWPLLAVCALAVIVPIVLTALGKNVPIVSSIINGALSLAVKIFPKKAAPAVAPSEEVKPAEGVSNVVNIHEEKTK